MAQPAYKENMRTAEEILDEFDDPVGGQVVNPDSTVSSTRERAALETLLDIRSLGFGIPAIYNGTTAVHIIGFIAEKVEVGKYAAVGYADDTGVLSVVSDLTKLVITI
jgi:hypothetical protein